ncbi:hypothetical protein OHA70_18175 [Kribbella sp. NBC_00382]|uniref:hypothetical protein n=1 Tax=Kribbella sp. NBC_00382 TaxID=2975967 RepID=UPI002E1E0F41
MAGFTEGVAGVEEVAGVDGLAEGDVVGLELPGGDVGLGCDSVVPGAVSAQPTRAAASNTATAHRPTIVGP